MSALGEEIARQVDELADELAGDDRPGEGYLAQAGRLMARTSPDPAAPGRNPQ